MVQIGPLCPQCAKGQSGVSHRMCVFFPQTRLSSAEKSHQGTDATVTLTSGVIVMSAVDRCPVDHAVYPGPWSNVWSQATTPPGSGHRAVQSLELRRWPVCNRGE